MSSQEAWALLEEFTKKEAAGLAQPLLATRQLRERLRDALLVAAAAPNPSVGWSLSPEAPEVLLGVLASDVRLAARALRDYTTALGLPFVPPESRVPGVAAAAGIVGPVYIKYNSARRLCYASAYAGRDRGVLVQLGQAQLGHLPLGLHDEAKAQPPPSLA
eukprot:scaffold9.g3136.t1